MKQFVAITVGSLAASLLLASQTMAENRTYRSVQLAGSILWGPNAGAGSSTGMVCNVNGPDGYLTIRSGPSSNYGSNRKLNRLAILTVSPAQRQGDWVPVRTAVRTHSKAGSPLGYEKSLHVTGWAHGAYICDYTTDDPRITSLLPVAVSPSVALQAATNSANAAQVAASSASALAVDSASQVKVLQTQLDELSQEIAILKEMRAQQQVKFEAAQTIVSIAKFDAVEMRITQLEEQASTLQKASQSRYQVPIRPSNPNLENTARKLSELFPKVPYYEVGTRQEGEMWIKPTITDGGEQLFEFSFLDPASKVDSVVETVGFTLSNMDALSAGFEKTHKWAEVAREQKVGRFQKTAACVTANDCDTKQLGKSSTAVQFRVYEDRSSGAQIVRNKGNFSTEFGFSIESALLLSAYADFIVKKATEEFDAGSRSSEEVNALFD